MTQTDYPIEPTHNEKKTSFPRCYVTFELEPDVVCHHCGRGMSPSHKKFKPDHAWKIWKKDTRWKKKVKTQWKAWERREFSKSRWRRILHALPLFRDYEFRGLDLIPEEAIHCEDCLHNQTRIFLLVLLLCSIIFGSLGGGIFAITNYSLLIGLLNLVLILVAIILLYMMLKDYNRNLERHLASFPIQGRNPLIKVNEFLRGEITQQSNGNYSGELCSGSYGMIDFSIKMANVDRRRFERYEKKYKRFLSRNHFIVQSAGFILYDLINRVNYDDNDVLLPERINTIAVQKCTRCARVAAHMEAEQSVDWQSTFAYQIELPSSEQEKLPIEIVPMVYVEKGRKVEWEITDAEDTESEDKEDVGVNANDRNEMEEEVKDSKESENVDGEEGKGAELRGVILDVQVNSDLINKKLKAASVELKELELTPVEDYGAVVLTYYPVTVNDRTVVWKKIKLEGDEDCIKHERLYVRFKNPVGRGAQFTGKMVLLFKNTAVSGIDNVGYYNSLGYPIEAIVKKSTEVTVKFDVTVVDEVQVEPISCTPKPIQKMIIPDYQMVAKLVADLGKEEKTYIQRVIENPPHTNRANAMKTNRVWDIAGRKYVKNFFPLDFHIVVMGWEEYEPQNDEPVYGHTTFKINVDASPIVDIEKEIRKLIKVIEDQIEFSVEDATKRATDRQKIGQLENILREYFNMEELKNLCMELNEDHEEFPQDKGKGVFIREFVDSFRRQKRLTMLLELCKKLRPNVEDWPEF